MHDARAVGLRQPLADLRGDVDGVVQRQRSPLDPLLQRLARVVRHHEVELAVVRFVDLVDRADVGVVQRRRRFGLLEEALLGRLVAGQIGRQDFDRHLTVKARVVGRVDDPHAAVAEFGEDRVRAERGAWGEWHGKAGLHARIPRWSAASDGRRVVPDDEVQGVEEFLDPAEAEDGGTQGPGRR